jgi:hypothetical protein
MESEHNSYGLSYLSDLSDLSILSILSECVNALIGNKISITKDYNDGGYKLERTGLRKDNLQISHQTG